MLGEFSINEALLEFKPYNIRLFLCKPNRTTIAELHEAYEIILKTNYNGIHELTFSIPYVIEKNKEFVRNPHVDLIRGHYLIRYEKWDKNNNILEKDYFIIIKPKNVISDGKEYKSVQTYLLPYELSNKIIRNYKATKRLYDPSGADSIFHDTFFQKTDWTIDYVDPDIMNKYRAIDISEMSLLQFLEQLVDTFNCVVKFDTINKKMGFYKNENIGRDRGLTIEYGKYLKTIDEDPDFDNVVTRLYVYGKDGLSIEKLNPSGTQYIESFDYYMYPFEQDQYGNVIKHSNFWSDDLCKAQINYQNLLQSKSGEFNTLLSQKETLQQTLTTKQNELNSLITELNIILDNLDVAIAHGDDTTALIAQRDEKQAQINAKQAEIDSVNAQIASVDSQIASLRSVISVENNFTQQQIVERNYYIREAVWFDNNYIDANELYEEAKKRLMRINQPRVLYSVDVVDIINSSQSIRDYDKVVLGDIVTIKYPNFNINIKAKIISIEHNLDQHSLRLEIGSLEDLKNGFLTLKDLFNKTITSSKTIDISKWIWDKSEENNSEIRQIINNAWDAAKQAVVAGTNENIVIDRRGLTAKSPTDTLNYIRILHNIIALTSDGGNTFRTAITPQGIVAEQIIGKLLLGERIIIGDSNGIFEIVGNLLTIRDNNKNIRTQLGEYATGQYGLKLISKTGNKTILDENGIMQTDTIQEADNVDASHPLKLKFYIDDNVLRIDKVKLNFSLEKFRAYSTSASTYGGTTITSASGGGSTPTSEEDVYHLYTTAVPDVLSWDGDHTHSLSSAGGHTHKYTYQLADGTWKDAYTSTEGNHTHDMSIEGGHSHAILSNHTHDVIIPPHTHTVDIPSHSHSIVYGIYESTTASGVKVKVDGVERLNNGGIGYSTDQSNLDLTQWITTPGWHTIELTSTQLGRINASLYVKSFVAM